MASPFPGMNPYLEQQGEWEEFHQRFITHMADVIGALVAGRYRVKIETRLYLHELSAGERRYLGKADVSIRKRHDEELDASAAVATIAAPVQLTRPAIDKERYGWIEILDRSNRRVVTAIELLSPTNKRTGSDRSDYLLKREQYLLSGVNLVQIDLNRGGLRPSPPDLPVCDYYALVARANELKFDVWPIALRERLPRIPIPLAKPDNDVLIDLQDLLNRVYDAAHYGQELYVDTPDLRLLPEEQRWATALIESARTSNP